MFLSIVAEQGWMHLIWSRKMISSWWRRKGKKEMSTKSFFVSDKLRARHREKKTKPEKNQRG
jgi:hypothetical protein